MLVFIILDMDSLSFIFFILVVVLKQHQNNKKKIKNKIKKTLHTHIHNMRVVKTAIKYIENNVNVKNALPINVLCITKWKQMQKKLSILIKK